MSRTNRVVRVDAASGRGRSAKRSPARRGIGERVDAKGVRRYRGTAYDRRTGKRLRGPWTTNLAEARSWRIDALARLQAGTLSGHRGPTLREAVKDFLAGIEDTSIRSRSGRPYKAATVRGYRRDLDGRLVQAFGASRLDDLTLPDVQCFADGLAREGLAPSTLRNIVTALRALYAWARTRGMARTTPLEGLRLPTGGQVRDRIATPDEASKLIAALRPRDQAALGLALYAGLRLGELLALDWSAIDLDGRTLRVERAWDHGAHSFVTPKSKAGIRAVPIVDRLALLLSDHRVLTNQTDGLLFPGTREPGRPVGHNALRDRMRNAWEAADLEGISFHEARHTFASLMIAAGVNAKALATYMGHSNISVTFDRYGHLMPGSEQEARGLLDAYLEREDT
jgi:integrase